MPAWQSISKDLISPAYLPPPPYNQDIYVDSMPPGTRGGTQFEYVFPADGEYQAHDHPASISGSARARSAGSRTNVEVLVDRRGSLPA